MTFLRNFICFGSPGFVIGAAPSGTRSRSALNALQGNPAGLALMYRKRPLEHSQEGQALARRPLERRANFSGRLVAILVQFLESLPQRPKFYGAFRRPIPVDVESVGGRWTGRRSLRDCQRRLHRCVVTVGGRHFCTPYKLGIRPDSIRWNFRVVTRWRCEFAPHSALLGCRGRVDLVAKNGCLRRMSGTTS
jgi:hypothetical protein